LAPGAKAAGVFFKEIIMSIGNPTEWLVKVSKVCRQMTEQAVVAYRDAQDYGVPQRELLDATQTVLRAYEEQLIELLPDDFPKSRLGDLSRHIHFCQQGDCIDIASADIPDVLEKAEQYALNHIPTNPSGDIGSYLHPYYRARLDRELATDEPDFHGLVLKSCVRLGDTFKHKTGVKDDKDSEIGRALKLYDPLLNVLPDISTETGKNFQRGTMLLMQGVRAYYRNTHAHSEIATTAKQAVQALTIISLLTEVIEGGLEIPSKADE
jgi:uncharacterized protein (TIGR02391 family)